jgi:hypothetical protein
MKATYKRYLAAAFATVGLMNLGVCQVSADPMGPGAQVFPTTPQVSQDQQGTAPPDATTSSGQPQSEATEPSTTTPDTTPTTDLGLRNNGTPTLETGSVPQIKINNTIVSFNDAQPGMINGQLMIPVRDVCEQIGASVHWMDQAKEVVLDLPSQNTVTLDTNKDWLAMIGNVDQAQLEQLNNGGPESSDLILQSDEVVLIGNRAYMPFDKLAVAINGSGDWDQSAGTATITTDENTSGEDSKVGTGAPINSEPTSPPDYGSTPNSGY